MKKVFLPFLSVVALSFATVSCSDDDPITPDPTPEGEEIVKEGEISENETWTAENIYVLDGRVVVNEGVTLTIEAGTIIKAEDGQGANATALIVDQGGKIMAEGTAENPIIFTSVNDEIAAGETESSLEVGDAGQWGGVIILGKAPISVANADGIGVIEGIPANLPYGQYGGNDAADNSGSLKYVSIRFSGTVLSTNSEIQGLTLGGVGSGTTVENIEIFSNKDDGIEWFGGTVNAKNILIYGQEDDGLDIDQAYAGTVENALVIMTENSGSAFEIDGPEGDMKDAFTFKNITVDMGNFEGKLIADFREGALGTLENIFVHNVNESGSTVNLNDERSVLEFNDDNLTFASWEIVTPGNKTIADLFTSKGTTAPVANKFTENATAVEEGTVGADVSVFDWTFTKSKGVF
ncbi:hypothetical protein [Sphingobacterium sp. SGR-19]|uniref:hypothetical protein n=1 Tax=Sphingobacterium sp. SGR-19 TaxID=2710886 RepID=UPI0013EB6533|nr:hypothetical protein [Sphingobacterium sp. SGR-19]NGM64992.1 hypothetical protein [Sphingobacterium sp. SGR-19]